MKRFLIVFCLVLTACATQRRVPPQQSLDDQPAAPRPTYAGGSLWQAGSAGIVDDFKARRRGDILTIIIDEQASASKQASTDTKRGSSLSAGIPNLLGLETSMTGIKNWMDLSNLLSASTDSKFDGSGSTSRKENLNATISARVVAVLPDGNLAIEGRRSVRVNNEDQLIVLEGKVRRRDISPDNTISSAMIADARITYAGNGIISDRQKPGWLMNVIDTVWPF